MFKESRSIGHVEKEEKSGRRRRRRDETNKDEGTTGSV